MKRLDIRSHLEDILENARLAKELVGTMSYEAFSQDIRTRLAVERTMEIIGEATKRLAVEVRNGHPDIAWRRMAGMRDVVSHQYRSVSPRVLYETAAKELNVLIDRLPAIIAEVCPQGPRE